LDDLVAPDSVDHDPAPGQGPGPQGYRDFFGDLRTAFPDLHIEVEHADDPTTTWPWPTRSPARTTGRSRVHSGLLARRSRCAACRSGVEGGIMTQLALVEA